MRRVLRTFPLPDASRSASGVRSGVRGLGGGPEGAGGSRAGRGTPAAAGLEVFLKGCTQCHTIDPFNVVAGDDFSGPNLTHFMDRGCIAGDYLEYSGENLARGWRTHPRTKPGSFMPDLGLTQQEIDAFTAFLETLR